MGSAAGKAEGGAHCIVGGVLSPPGEVCGAPGAMAGHKPLFNAQRHRLHEGGQSPFPGPRALALPSALEGPRGRADKGAVPCVGWREGCLGRTAAIEQWPHSAGPVKPGLVSVLFSLWGSGQPQAQPGPCAP